MDRIYYIGGASHGDSVLNNENTRHGLTSLKHPADFANDPLRRYFYTRKTLSIPVDNGRIITQDFMVLDTLKTDQAIEQARPIVLAAIAREPED